MCGFGEEDGLDCAKMLSSMYVGEDELALVGCHTACRLRNFRHKTFIFYCDEEACAPKPKTRKQVTGATNFLFSFLGIRGVVIRVATSYDRTLSLDTAAM